jgi:hypothetical protein
MKHRFTVAIDSIPENLYCQWLVHCAHHQARDQELMMNYDQQSFEKVAIACLYVMMELGQNLMNLHWKVLLKM